MPSNNQNQLLKEKLLVLNEKLVNVFEELNSVQIFHSKLNSFFHTLRSRVVNDGTIFSPPSAVSEYDDAELQGQTRHNFNPNNMNVVLDHDTISLVDT